MRVQATGTPWSNDPKYTDISVAHRSRYDEKIARAEFHKPPKEAWWYVCASPSGCIDSPWTNYWIDEVGSDLRLHFWRAWRKGVQGFLYWGVNWWNQNTVDWLTDGWIANPYPGCNGDGYLMYPGPNGEAYGSVRLSVMRDGIEDYDYLAILAKMMKQAQGESSSQTGQWLAEALKLAAQINQRPDMMREKQLMYKTHCAQLLRFRDEAAKLIERDRAIRAADSIRSAVIPP